MRNFVTFTPVKSVYQWEMFIDNENRSHLFHNAIGIWTMKYCEFSIWRVYLCIRAVCCDFKLPVHIKCVVMPSDCYAMKFVLV